MRRSLVRLSTVGVAAMLVTVWGAGAAFAAPVWSTDVAPEPPGAVSTALAATDCVTAKLCFAVGVTSDDAVHPGFGYVARSAHGEWVDEPTPELPVDHSALADVDCYSAKACMAVGQFTGMAGGPARAYALQLQGRTWTALTLQSPGATGDGTRMYGVSCPSVNTCFAVGEYDTGAGSEALIQRWNGSTWSLLSFPFPTSGNDGVLYDIDCASVSSCVAVGFFPDLGTYGLAPWALRWNGTSWSQESTVRPTSIAGFIGVSCASTNACVAVGVFADPGSGDAMPLTEHWDGSAWTLRPGPPATSDDPNLYDLLYDVSCPRANACVAVGVTETSTGDNPLAAEWNGETWQVEELPEAPPESRLFGVSCAMRLACVAVGNSNSDIEGVYRPLVMRSE